MKREMFPAGGRPHLEERPSSEPKNTPKKTFALFFFFFFFSQTYIFRFVRGPSHPCATVTAVRVVENVFQARLSSARQRCGSSFFDRLVILPILPRS